MRRLQGMAFVAVVLFIGAFVLVDFTIIQLIDGPQLRLVVRWLLIGGTCALLTITLSRRTVNIFVQSMRGERAARDEAEALADLTATIAAGLSIKDTLAAVVGAVPRLLGKHVSCAIALPAADGTLRFVATNQPDRPDGFAFAPGEGFTGLAFSETRTIRIDDAVASSESHASVAGRGAAPRALMVVPLVADQRTLGIIATSSETPAAFGEHEERVLTAVARHAAVALLATEARDAAYGEAAKKSAIIDQLGDAVLVGDSNRRVIECNRAAAALFDVRAEDLLGLGTSSVPWELFGADDVAVARGRGPLNRAMSGESVTGEYRIVTHTGIERRVAATGTPLRAADGSLNGAILVLRDVAEAQRAERQLRESEERYRRLVELCPDPIVVHCDGIVVYANQATFEMAGAAGAADVIGKSMLDLVRPDFHLALLERARNAAHGESGGTNEMTLKRLDGELVPIEATTMQIMFEGRPATQAVLRDITVRKSAEAALAHQALHDALTGLPNRVLLLDRLQQAIAAAQRDGSTLSLLLMDLDRFKEVNDTLGHHAGDLLLQQVGIRMRGGLRQADTIARLGGDEFAVILPDTDAEGVITVVENLLRRLQAPFSVENQPVVVGASIGIALSPDHGVEADALMRRADVAMYVAKRSTVGFSIYRAEQDRNSADRLSLIGELQRAIDEGELVLHYQPKVDLRTKQLVGVEALVRWEHPLRGLLTPDQFIPVAEQAGLIERLSRWVLRAALLQVNAWRRIGLDIPVAVNLSMRSFRDEALPDQIRDLLSAGQTPPHLLMLEITESTLMIDPPRTFAILSRLRAMGIRVAIDDFGTGHSSLAYLKRLPVDEIKIDRSFVKDIATDPTDRVIVKCTVELAHSLGLRVVAEGVEDAVTQAVVAELGCDEAQGFYLSPALRGRALTSWLSEQTLAA